MGDIDPHVLVLLPTTHLSELHGKAENLITAMKRHSRKLGLIDLKDKSSSSPPRDFLHEVWTVCDAPHAKPQGFVQLVRFNRLGAGITETFAVFVLRKLVFGHRKTTRNQPMVKARDFCLKQGCLDLAVTANRRLSTCWRLTIIRLAKRSYHSLARFANLGQAAPGNPRPSRSLARVMYNSRLMCGSPLRKADLWRPCRAGWHVTAGQVGPVLKTRHDQPRSASVSTTLKNQSAAPLALLRQPLSHCSRLPGISTASL